MHRLLRVVLAGALVVAAPIAATAADVAPRFLIFDVRVDHAAHSLRVDTVVADDARQVGGRRYRTRLQYRCSGPVWRTAFGTAPTGASITRTWTYPRALVGRRCELRATVELGRTLGRSMTVRRQL